MHLFVVLERASVLFPTSLREASARRSGRCYNFQTVSPAPAGRWGGNGTAVGVRSIYRSAERFV